MLYVIINTTSSYLLLDLNNNPNKKANPTAAAMPPAVACKPPVKTPINPVDLTALMAPLASEAPKPIIGTVIPALANEDIGAKIPTASKSTPIKTKITSILEEVILVVIIKTSPRRHINPPIKKTHK